MRPAATVLSIRVCHPTVNIARRAIRSHSRAYENTNRVDDPLEREREKERGGPGPGWGPGFSLESPRQLVRYLDSYIVGQERAKKVLSVAVFNHYNRIRAKLQAQAFENDTILQSSSSANGWDVENPERPAAEAPPHFNLQPHPHRRSSNSNSRSHIFPQDISPIFEKSNVLLIGPTGSGKTLLARTLARVLDVPFAMSDATTLTQAGYVGEDVETCVHRLLQAADWDVHRAGVGIIVLDEADKLARRGSSGSDSSGRDVSGEGVQQALLRMLEGSVVNVNAKAIEGSGGGDIVGPGSSSGGRGRKGTPNPPPTAPKSETYQVDTSDILFILSGAFVGLDKVVQQRVAKGSIGFGAVLPNSSLSKPSGSSLSSSSSFLPFFTPNSETEINHYDMVEPVDLIKYGFIPEFTSRLPTITALKPLTTADLMRVLTEVRGALAKQYEALFGYSGVEIRFTTSALRAICEKAVERGMGARGLRGIMESLLLDSMYDVPGSSIRYVLIDLAVVQGKRVAQYWSRGEGGAFYGALAAEEELDAKQRAGLQSTKEDLEIDSVIREVQEREVERAERLKSRG